MYNIFGYFRKDSIVKLIKIFKKFSLNFTKEKSIGNNKSEYLLQGEYTDDKNN